MGSEKARKRSESYVSSLQMALTVREVTDAFMTFGERLVPSDGHGIYQFASTGRSVVDASVAKEQRFLTDYEEYGRADDPLLEFVFQKRIPIDSSRLPPSALWESSGARVAISIDGYRHALEAPIMVAGTVIGTINFVRGEDKQAFTGADLRAAAFVTAQLGLAVARARRYEEAFQRADTWERALDRLPQQLIITDLDSKVLFRNRAAQSLSSHGALDPHGSASQLITEAMHAFLAEGTRIHQGKLPASATDEQVITKSYRLSGPRDVAITLVFTTSGEEGNTLPTWSLLSPREQYIVKLVAKGLSTKHIAERAFISQNTVKQHLKRIFAKTDVHSRAELVQLTWAHGSDATSS